MAADVARLASSDTSNQQPQSSEPIDSPIPPSPQKLSGFRIRFRLSKAYTTLERQHTNNRLKNLKMDAPRVRPAADRGRAIRSASQAHVTTDETRSIVITKLTHPLAENKRYSTFKKNISYTDLRQSMLNGFANHQLRNKKMVFKKKQKSQLMNAEKGYEKYQRSCDRSSTHEKIKMREHNYDADDEVSRTSRKLSCDKNNANAKNTRNVSATSKINNKTYLKNKKPNCFTENHHRSCSDISHKSHNTTITTKEMTLSDVKMPRGKSALSKDSGVSTIGSKDVRMTRRYTNGQSSKQDIAMTTSKQINESDFSPRADNGIGRSAIVSKPSDPSRRWRAASKYAISKATGVETNIKTNTNQLLKKTSGSGLSRTLSTLTIGSKTSHDKITSNQSQKSTTAWKKALFGARVGVQVKMRMGRKKPIYGFVVDTESFMVTGKVALRKQNTGAVVGEVDDDNRSTHSKRSYSIGRKSVCLC